MVSLRYENLAPEWLEGAARCEAIAFPEADTEDLLGPEDFGHYLRLFPEGVFVVIDDDAPPGEEVVGVGAGIFVDFDFDNIEHTIWEVAGEHQCSNHDPDGDWYYGTDITVLPSYRGHGIGRKLYDLRKDVVRRFGKLGIIAGGHLPGYAEVKDTMTAEEYVAEVVAGRRGDATLSFQLKNGFEVRGVIQNYFADPSIDNKASLIVWEVD
jgi:GNAT superfamily N-acetyltransferase